MAQSEEDGRPGVRFPPRLRPPHKSANPCSSRRTIAFTAMGGTISASVFFPALGSLQQELKANDALVAASVSSFIAGQGVFPLLWSSLSEVTGRKKCYIVALGALTLLSHPIAMKLC